MLVCLGSKITSTLFTKENIFKNVYTFRDIEYLLIKLSSCRIYPVKYVHSVKTNCPRRMDDGRIIVLYSLRKIITF